MASSPRSSSSCSARPSWREEGGSRSRPKRRGRAALDPSMQIYGDQAARLRRLVLLLHELRRALLKFSRRHVLDVGADVPAVAGRIRHPATAVTIELVRRLHQRCGAGLKRLLIDRIDIGYVEIQHDGGG